MKRIILFLLAAASAFATGTVQQSIVSLGATGNYALTFYWVGDSANGSVPVTLAQLGLASQLGQGMRILEVETVPGSPAPTNNYTAKILDSFGGDMMAGSMVGNLNNASVQLFSATSATPPITGGFSLSISGQSVVNAQGKIVVYFGPTTLVNATAGSPGPAGPTGNTGPPGPTGSFAGVSALAYNFTPQNPALTLSATISASPTLSPCPLGVGGSDAAHWLYITDGASTPEAVLIVGGTCTSGAGSGTVTFTPAFNHSSGNWALGSASLGIAEAFNVNNWVTVGTGSCGGTIQATITPPAGGTLEGAGRGVAQQAGGGCLLNYTSGTVGAGTGLTTHMFQVINNNVRIWGFQLKQTGTAAAGNAAIYVAGGGSGVGGAGANWGDLRDISTWAFFNGFKDDGSAGAMDLTRFQVDASVGDGMIANGAQGVWFNVITEFNAGNGLVIATCAAGSGCGVAPVLNAFQTFNNGLWGITASTYFQMGAGSIINADKSGEIHVTTSSGNPTALIGETQLAACGLSPTFGTNTSGDCLVSEAGGAGVQLTNVNIFFSEGNCINMKNAGDNSFVNVNFQNCGQGAQAGHTFSVLLASTSINTVMADSYLIPAPVSSAANQVNFRTNTFAVNSASPALEITAGLNVRVDGNAISNAGGGASLQVDGGATLTDGVNNLSGTYTNNGARSSIQTQHNVFPLLGNVNPVTIASGATIAPAAPLAIVSGTSTITTITPPSNYAATYFCAIPSAIWATNTGGNIALASTAVVNKVLCFYFDLATTLWYPSY